ncbi:ribulose-phosphate 3-epimerase [Candidatus Epulonipiscium fishelsonii]|uniref:Ribulose-phosphate 3-epimerase n=1 Tax=Candidatus Epulonipiscium fishelsonii TaxID=77094 RepID=A0ACC8XEV0_9FIRM|nr:ribulose-phosphate 3-epimerase [Epulopiscium sp. SCG-B05WGA-EpuloA1]ONI41900.1 ribulose-phosphate 3-epimerase [Epulopiscium sp. SCG-B11WGA-EpuloA1]
MKKYISTSLMCLDLMEAKNGIIALEQVGMDYFHMDVMDNHFVPNFSLSSDFIKVTRKCTQVPLDIHLMIENPENSLHLFDGANEGDILSIHYESTKHVQKVLSEIRKMGYKAGIALNPATPLNVLEEVIEDLDMVLIMTVNPGFAGQKLIPSTLGKIQKCKDFLVKVGAENILIEVDGNVSFENAVKMNKMGADIFVAGTSSVFSKEGTLEENTKKMRKILEGSLC